MRASQSEGGAKRVVAQKDRLTWTDSQTEARVKGAVLKYVR